MKLFSLYFCLTERYTLNSDIVEIKIKIGLTLIKTRMFHNGRKKNSPKLEF